MENGTVKSYDMSCGVGMINREPEDDVRFYSESVVGKGRAGLTEGDSVWFEIGNVRNLDIAINVRRIDS
jgi:cold shock CspA family protein